MNCVVWEIIQIDISREINLNLNFVLKLNLNSLTVDYFNLDKTTVLL